MNPYITATALGFAVNVLVSILKRWVYPKWGKFGVQVVAFILAAIAAAYFMYKELVPGLEAFVIATLAFFSTVVTFYEVVLQYLPWFKVTTPAVEAAREEARS